MTSHRSSERGIALIAVMFMVLTLSLIGSSLMFASRTETLSSLNYKTVSQVRYASESGIHGAANYILWTYAPPTLAGADPIGVYDLTTSPVRFNNLPVVLSSDPAVAANYPVVAVRNAFSAATQGNLNAGNGTVGYSASATLMTMRQITDVYTGNPVTLQTWQITGTGTAAGAGSALVQVTAILERQDRPAYQYAAFATNNGCGSMTLTGNSSTDSYDSSTYNGVGSPVISLSGSNVGTNGNLGESGGATVHGSLSTPRSGVGACSEGNITALTQAGHATVDNGITQLSQPITFPTPPAPSPAPPTSNDNFTKNSGCTADATFCTAQAGHGATIHPPAASTVVQLGDIHLTGGCELHLSAGIYQVNSINFAGGSTIIVDGAGPVIFQVAGVDQATPIDLTGGSVSNLTYNPQALQFIYGGAGTVKMNGGAAAATLVYAPNAEVSINGGADFYGAIVAGRLTDTGGAIIHYDRNLQKAGTTDGNPVLDQFSWRNY